MYLLVEPTFADKMDQGSNYYAMFCDHTLQLHETTEGSMAQLQEELRKKNEELASLHTNMQQVFEECKQKVGSLTEQIATMKKELELKVYIIQLL